MALKKLVTNSFDDDSVTSAKLANALVSDINTGVNFSVPAGGIIMWSGATNAIPTGWVLCDGQNGTPDLRDKFVIGASAGSGDTSYPGLSPNATGGSAAATLPQHNHTATSTSTSTSTFSGSGNVIQGGGVYGEGGGSGTIANSGSVSTTTTTTTTIANEGVADTSLANLPPYMALAYIMKTA